MLLHIVVFLRLSVIVAITISIGWVNMLHNAGGGQIYKYFTGVQGYLQSPISVVFILAAFWPRCNLPVRKLYFERQILRIRNKIHLYFVVKTQTSWIICNQVDFKRETCLTNSF